ncbi:MAG: protein of unknown function, TPR-like [Nitrospira sp.]|nr:protein of unknown function, TPR-like [Nitrospira sp.]
MASSPRITPSAAAEIDRLATALAKDPRSKAFLPLAEEYIKAGMWQEAVAVLEDGLTVYPTFVTAMAALGRVYDQLGQPVKAKAILVEVIKQSPDNLRAHRILANLFAAEGNAESALRSCSAILNANACDAEALAIKRRFTGDIKDPPLSKRNPAPVNRETKPGTGNNTTVMTAIPPLASAPAGMPSEPVIDQPRLAHAATIVRLEAWLRAIQTKRHKDSDPI